MSTSARFKGLEESVVGSMFPLRRFSRPGAEPSSVCSPGERTRGLSWPPLNSPGLGGVVETLSAMASRAGGSGETAELPLSRDSPRTRLAGPEEALDLDEFMNRLRRMGGRWIFALGGNGMATGDGVFGLGTKSILPWEACFEGEMLGDMKFGCLFAGELKEEGDRSLKSVVLDGLLDNERRSWLRAEFLWVA